MASISAFAQKTISAFAQKTLLDFVGGAAGEVIQPNERWCGLAWGTPTYTAGSEIDASFGYGRLTCLFGEAASPAGSMTVTAAMTFWSFSSACSVLGVLVFDGSGRRLNVGMRHIANAAGDLWRACRRLVTD